MGRINSRGIQPLLAFRDRVAAWCSILRCLTSGERAKYVTEIADLLRTSVLAAAPDPATRKKLEETIADLTDLDLSDEGGLRARIDGVIAKACAEAEAKAQEARNPKPRNVERDAAIERLRDQEQLPWGAIPRRLKEMNPAWSKSDGSPLSQTTVRQAYARARAKGDDGGKMV